MPKRTLNIKKIAGFIFLATLILAALTFFLGKEALQPAHSVTSPSMQNNEDKENPATKAKEPDVYDELIEHIDSTPVTYSFAGKKTYSELVGATTDHNNSASQADENGFSEAGNNTTKDGDIPDLTIWLNGMDIEYVAKKLGFQLVASTKEQIIGKIANGKLIAMDETERNKYADRAREATDLSNYYGLVNGIAKHTNVAKHEIRLFYLVPISVERSFIQFQRAAIQESGIPANDIGLMIAKYRPDLELEIVEVIRK